MSPTENYVIPSTNGDATTNVVALANRPEPATSSERAMAFVKEHPVLTIAGGVAAGFLINALIPRRANRRLSNRALRIAEAGAAAALSFGQDTWDKAEDGGIIARRKAKLFAHQAEKLGGRAAARAERLSAVAGRQAERLSEKAAARAERMGVAALGAASTFGHAAADRADKLGHAAATHAESLGGRTSDRLSQLGDKALVQSSKLFGYPKARVTLADRLADTFHGLRARLRG
jgi:hypothetical protein